MPGVGKKSDHRGECRLAQQLTPYQAEAATRPPLLRISARRERPGVGKAVHAAALGLEPFHSHNRSGTLCVRHDVAKVGTRCPAEARTRQGGFAEGSIPPGEHWKLPNQPSPEYGPVSYSAFPKWNTTSRV